MDSLLQGFTSLTSALNNGFGLVGSLLSQPAPLSTLQEAHQTASVYDFPEFSYRATLNRNHNDFAKLWTIFEEENKTSWELCLLLSRKKNFASDSEDVLQFV